MLRRVVVYSALLLAAGLAGEGLSHVPVINNEWFQLIVVMPALAAAVVALGRRYTGWPERS